MTTNPHSTADESGDEPPTRIQIRRQIKQRCRDDGQQRAELVDQMTDTIDCDESQVEAEIDACEQHGFVYIVDGEVRIP